MTVLQGRIKAAVRATALSLVIAVVPVSDGAAADNVIKVGASNALSGLASAVCSPVTQATEKWFAHVNTTGGINGRKIQYTVLDDGLDPARAIANARRLVEQDGVFAIVSGCGTAPSGAIGEYATGKNVVFLGPYSAADSMVVPPKKTIFGVLPLYAVQMAGLIPWTFKTYGPGSVMTIQFAKSELFDKMTAEAVTSQGGKMLGGISFKVGQPSFTSEILQMQQANPDYIVFTGSATDAARLVQGMEQQRYKPRKKIIGTSVMTDATYLSNAGAYANGLSVAAGATVLAEDPSAVECEKALGASRGTLTQFQLYGCGVGQIFTDAVKQLGNTPTSDALARLLDGSFSASVGAFAGRAKASADHLLLHDLIVVEVEGGKFVSRAKFVAPAVPKP